jgi:hypothetical protein
VVIRLIQPAICTRGARGRYGEARCAWPSLHPALGVAGAAAHGALEYGTGPMNFSCSQCCSEAWLAVIEPIREAGMQDYRLDAIERPERHPAAVDRLTGGSSQSSVSYSGRELPGRKIDGRR